MAELPLDFLQFVKNNQTGKVKVSFKDGIVPLDNGLRDSYDRIIRCMGWKFDDTVFSRCVRVSSAIFHASFCVFFFHLSTHKQYFFRWQHSDTQPRHPIGRAGKYPLINADYQSPDYPGLYFAGTNTHSLDFRRSAGGFIHGFRYTGKSVSDVIRFCVKHRSDRNMCIFLSIEIYF